jgi:ATP-dependent Clp protease ATP-binding subunit ClpB
MTRTNKPLDPSLTGQHADRLEAKLKARVVGQDEAIGHIVNIYQTYLAGMNPPGRPVGNFLFLGPTGSGKTRLVEATAEALVNDSQAVIKVDCAEFQHSHEIAKLIGSPPGYLGHRETHPMLCQETLNQYHTETCKLSFVLFDEIEKASDALWNLLLGILDKATLTLGDNRRVDFSRALIFMTSNLGAAEMESLLHPRLGFGAEPDSRETARTNRQLDGKIARTGLEAARKKFTPEFLNRIDKVVVFRPLGEPELRRILDIELQMVQRRVFESPVNVPFVFSLTASAKEHLLAQGTDVKYGARHLKRVIERSLVHPLSNLIATEQIRARDMVRVDYDHTTERLVFTKEAEDLPEYAMTQLIGSSFTSQLARMAGSVAVEAGRAAGSRGTRRA